MSSRKPVLPYFYKALDAYLKGSTRQLTEKELRAVTFHALRGMHANSRRKFSDLEVEVFLMRMEDELAKSFFALPRKRVLDS